ncbi:hypothetical protein GCM10010277_57240 [Streptomyces longisporoflavus]|uniref:hypothetical protein n=1 Tax=Streptomyces longisporoflavus TaxID=28044 RepID=UPI00167EA61E|nr:hypothetical protein [Streptomyces longisporoflavus]GGV56209.1 hypothetical protein GCM10010277_57240 [Streptomyces longisporoflavus]
MDQGLAAILGAAVGAIATGAAALVTASSASRLNKSKARQEACLAYLTLLAQIRVDLVDLGRRSRPHPADPYEPLDAATARARAADIDARYRELITKHAVLMLAGPRRVYRQAVRTSDLVAEPLMLVLRWSAGPAPSAVPAEHVQAFDRGMEALARGLAEFADTAREST